MKDQKMRVYAEQPVPVCKPQATALCQQAFDLMQKGDQTGAYHAYLSAIKIDPRCAEAWIQIGDALSANKKFELAMVVQRYGLSLEKSAFQYLRYANALSQNLRYDEAKEHFWNSIKLNGKLSKAWYGLAYIAMEEGDGAKAREYIDAALTRDPEVPDIHYTSALIGLMFGDWERGFSADYESRFQLKTAELPKDIPPWTGQDLKGKHLLVLCEQGFGDCFLMLRFLRLVPKNCERVSLMVPKNLRRLVDYNYDHDYEIYNAGTHECMADYCVSIGSIPFYTMTPDFSVEVAPYISAPDVFFKRTPATKAVGIAWQGDGRHPNDRLRTISALDMVVALLRPGIDLCSLQVGGDPVDSALIGEMGMLRDLGKHFGDFYDTACIIKQLDVVVCIDSVIANLCGAMGKLCHVLIPYGGVDWRWSQTARSPWYPSIRIHRQGKGEPWSAVLERVQL